MAKEAKPAAEVVAVAPPKKSKKLLIMIAAALVLILVIGGGGVLFIMKKNSANADAEGEVASETSKSAKKESAKEAAPIYVALDAFTVNLVGEQFLQLILSVEVSDLLTGDKVKTHTPKIRNNVMLLLSGKQVSDLVTREGKETLAKEIRDLMNEVLEPEAKKGEGPIKDVLFTSFIMQ